MQNPRWIILTGIAAMFIAFASASFLAQEPPPPPPDAPPASQPPAPAKPAKQKYSHANDFLIIGTVFDPKGYAFPGVELKISPCAFRKARTMKCSSAQRDSRIKRVSWMPRQA